MSKSKKSIFAIIFVFILFVVVGLFLYIKSITSTKFDIDKIVYLYIDNNKDYNSILTQLDTTAHIQDLSSFKKVADFYKYSSNIRTGRYAIKPNMDVRDVVLMLKSGSQAPVRLKFNNIRTKEDLSERLANQLMLTDSAILVALNNSIICQKYGFTTETIPCMFIPNTYEVYWDMSIDNLLDRMSKEYNKFWTVDRINKAQAEGLTPVQASILASIVEEECFFKDEYPVVAELYLNRLKRNILLQADPTVKFAVGDFSLKRILYAHLEVDSPYNTYKNEGLPPGPIRIPSIAGIESVLNPADHEYLYMCAKEDFSGRHNFAKTHAEHSRNADRYRAALNRRGIR